MEINVLTKKHNGNNYKSDNYTSSTRRINVHSYTFNVH